MVWLWVLLLLLLLLVVVMMAVVMAVVAELPLDNVFRRAGGRSFSALLLTEGGGDEVISGDQWDRVARRW